MADAAGTSTTIAFFWYNQARISEVRSMTKAIVALLVASAGLSASGLGVDFDQAFSNTFLLSPSYTLGWEFQTVNAVKVTHLGFYDSGQDGLAGQYPLGLWNSAGTLLASATVSSGTSDPLVGKFRMVDISDVLLDAGQNFRVGALFTTVDDTLLVFSVAGFVTDPNILFVSANSSAQGPTLSDPFSQMIGTLGHFGPNIQLANVPEASSLALMVAGVVALALRARYRGRAHSLTVVVQQDLVASGPLIEH